MMANRHCGRTRPPWWPEGEAWPPYRDDVRQKSRARRIRFFRRVAILGMAVLLLGVCGIVALFWLLFTKLGIAASSPRGAALVLVVGGLLGATAAIIAAIAMMRRVGSPLAGLMEAAEQVARGDYSVRVTERGPPPLRALARAFNTMTERLRSHDRLRRDLMADVAHELRTPLAVIQGKLEGLLDGVYQRDDAQLTELLAEVHVLGRLVEDLRTLALSDSGALKLEKESTDIGSLADEVTRSLQGQARSQNVELRAEGTSDLPPLLIDAVRIREVLANLVTNALEHTPPGGAIVIHLADSSDKRVSIEVADTGGGMTPEETERAFERFHKGPHSRGLGLGLAIARNLVMAHGGEIRIASEPGRGTNVSFTLPEDVPG